MGFVVIVMCAALSGALPAGESTAAASQSADVKQLLARGNRALEAGRMDDAESAFERAVAAAPGNVDAHVQLGIVYLFTDRSVQARLQFESATALHDGDGDLLLRIGSAYVRAERMSEAEEYLSRARDRAPAMFQAHLLLGQVYLATGRRDRAIAEFSEAIRLDQNSAHAHYSLGIAYTLDGRRDQGLVELARATTLAPENAGFGFYLGIAYLEARNDTAAAAELERVVTLSPSDVEARVNLAWALINLGKPAAAADALDVALAQQPTNAVAWFLRGEAARRLQDDDKAIESYERATSIDQAMTDPLFALAMVYYRRNDTVRSEEWLARLLAVDPDHVGGHYAIGKLRLQEGKVEEAITHLELCTRRAPDNKAAHYQLSRAYALKGDSASAGKEMEIVQQLGEGGSGDPTSADERLATIGNRARTRPR